jgi:hypothetical protein
MDVSTIPRIDARTLVFLFTALILKGRNYIMKGKGGGYLKGSKRAVILVRRPDGHD